MATNYAPSRHFESPLNAVSHSFGAYFQLIATAVVACSSTKVAPYLRPIVFALAVVVLWRYRIRSIEGLSNEKREAKMTQVGQASESFLCYWAGLRLEGASRRMAAVSKTIARIAASSRACEDHQDSRTREVDMAKVIEFYIPQNFRRPKKWVSEQRGQILELRPQTTKSA